MTRSRLHLGAEFSAADGTDLLTTKKFHRTKHPGHAANEFDIETRPDGVAMLVFAPPAHTPDREPKPASVAMSRKSEGGPMLANR